MQINKNTSNLLISTLIEAKAYLGLTKTNWNTNLNAYCHGIRNGFCIFNLDKTSKNLKKAVQLIKQIHNNKGTILFVGMPQQDLQNIQAFLNKKNHCYQLTQFWENGTLTNGKSLFISKKNFLQTFKTKREKDRIVFFQKFAGILKLTQKPDLVVIYNHPKRVGIINEAAYLNIPVISFVNSEDSVTNVDYPIPGNFTSKKAGILYQNLLKHSLH